MPWQNICLNRITDIYAHILGLYTVSHVILECSSFNVIHEECKQVNISLIHILFYIRVGVYMHYTHTHIYIYICLLLISMLWHRQAIFESKGDKLSSSAESRIRTWKSQDTNSPADWMPTHKPTELSRIKLKKLELNNPSLWWVSIQPTWLHCRLAFAPGSGVIHVCCC